MVGESGDMDKNGSRVVVEGSPEIFVNLLSAIRREHLYVQKRCETLELENKKLKSCFRPQMTNVSLVNSTAPDTGRPGASPCLSNEVDRELGDSASSKSPLPKPPSEEPVPTISQLLQGPIRPSTPSKLCTPRTPHGVDSHEVQDNTNTILEHLIPSQDAEQLVEYGATWSKKGAFSDGRTSEVQDEVMSEGSAASELQPWQQDLVDVFTELDQDGSGSLNTNELRSALELAGVPRARLAKLIRIADADNSGEIELAEWMKAISFSSAMSSGLHEIQMLGARLSATKKLHGGSLMIESDHDKCCGRSSFMLSPLSYLRLSWDACISVLCMYICVALPFILAWEEDMGERTSDGLFIADQFINYVFIIDVLLNFRTGYFDQDGDLIMDWRQAGKNYVMTWFLFDVSSCFPFDLFEGRDSGVSPNRAIKIAKLVKLLRLSRLVRPSHFLVEDVSEALSDIFQWKPIQVLQRRSGIFMWAVLITHWLACGMKLVDDGWLSSYDGIQDSPLSVIWSEYFAGFYWAMTTITTVGYGDITPSSDSERAFSVLSMAVGGAFYGYVVGAITSLVQNSDINTSAYYDRLDLIDAWLLHHQLPSDVKRKVRRYFKTFLSEKSAINEAEVWADISPELQREIGVYIIHEDVRNNPLFDGMSLGGVVKLQSILHRATLFPGTTVATKGEVGTAMYIIVSGWMKKELRKNREESLGPGQSFGEEVVLGLRENYEYSVTVHERANVEMILESEFVTLFQPMPNLLEKMRQNALELNPSWSHAPSRLANRSITLSRMLKSRSYEMTNMMSDAKRKQLKNTPPETIEQAF